MLELPPSIIIILSSIAGISSLLYIREYFLRKKNVLSEQKISQDIKQKSMQMLHAAELAETQVIADTKYSSLKLESQFKNQLEQFLLTSEKSITQSQDTFIKFMQDLQKRGEDFEEASRTTSQDRINNLFERLEQRLSDFVLTAEQKTTSSIDLELKATRALIETYKNAQLKLIDENIIAMMEQTLNIVLGKKLSLKDQLELVYEALERAKVDKFVI